jgi:hypothetical protein
MSIRTFPLSLLIVAFLLVLVLPVQAQTDDQNAKVVYLNTFSSDPHWITNSPSSDYWDPSLGMYHFTLEPSTGNYAYTKVDSVDGSFTLEYDVLLQNVDPDATFRFGFTGAEMDPNKGPNVLSEFTNAKFGQIMWLHLVTPGNKEMEVNSQTGDSLTSGPTAYSGPTVKYELNKTYHVTMNYDDARKILSIQYNEKVSGKEIWGYYLNTAENLHGMNVIYLGSRGDYGRMYTYAQGYIDNVRLTVPGAAATPEPTFATPTETPVPGVTTKKPTLIPTTVSTPPATAPTQSPLSGSLAMAALGLVGLSLVLSGMRKN